ncbi:MAG: Holliday junction branch migration DNA helicase RuvB [Candidatus Ancillula sp.]|jgi:Holliday junction DNA helicase RuvB|nr:Holliday junction branch migration DNA helicase RuvB [Candidatus Ancillula sp.]
MDEENLTSAIELDSDHSSEIALRPKTLDEFVGQGKVTKQLQLILKAATLRGEASEHLLFAGPPGLGKTTLAGIVANELDAAIRVTSGPSLTHAGDLASILSSLEPKEVLFIDEIHRMAKPAQEMLYIAMEDFRVDVVVGKGVGASSIALPLPRFTVIGATTRSGLLPTPMRDRFGFTGFMDFYEPEELLQIVLRSANLLGVKIAHEAALEIAKRSRGTARIANRILRRVRDWAHVHGDEQIDLQATQNTLELYEIDQAGLDNLDRRVLKSIIEQFAAGPVGVSTLANSIGEEVDTVESVSEPFLVRKGFIARTKSGRVATERGILWYNTNI